MRTPHTRCPIDFLDRYEVSVLLASPGPRTFTGCHDYTLREEEIGL